MKLLKKAVHKAIRSQGFELVPQSRLPAPGFFPVAQTCQIVGLSGLYEIVFGQRAKGTFVEIGAFDGESYSNTSGLADLGWRGVYVEPVPEYAAMTRARHSGNSVTVIQKAVGREAGKVELTVGGALSSANPEMVDAYAEIAWADMGETRKIEVEKVTLDSLLESCGLTPGFDLLCIDTEGYEEEVMAGFSLAKWQPTMLIIELADFHPDLTRFRDRDAGIGDLIQSQSYAIAYKDSINTVFVRKSASETK